MGTPLGNCHDRAENVNIEEGLLTDWLKRNGQGDRVFDKVLRELDEAASLGGSKALSPLTECLCYFNPKQYLHITPSEVSGKRTGEETDLRNGRSATLSSLNSVTTRTSCTTYSRL